MITLVGEVIYYKRKGINKVKETKSIIEGKLEKNIKDLFSNETKIVTFGTTFKPVNTSSTSHITVYPRPALHPIKGFDTFLN